MDPLRPLGAPAPTPAARPAAAGATAPALPQDPVDTARIGGAPPRRRAADAALALSAAVRSGVAGAGGPVLERELRALELPLLKSRWLRLPFMQPHKAVSAEEAAGFLAKGKGHRVHVDLGGGPRALAGPEDLAALQHLRGLSTERSAPLEARLLEPFAVAGEKAQPLDAYDGYLRLKAHEPVALLHDGLPLLQGADAAQLQAALPEAARSADALRDAAAKDGSPALLSLFRHVVSVMGEDPETLARVLPEIAIPHADGPPFRASCVEMLKAGVGPAEVEARQRLIAGPGYAARVAFLKPFGIASPETPLATLQAAEDTVRALTAANVPEAEARAAAQAVRAALERARRTDLVETLRKLVDSAGGGLQHLDEFRGLVGGEEAAAAFDRAVRQGRGVVRAFGEVGGLTEALHRSGMTWRSQATYQAYEGLLGGGDVAVGAAFLRDLVLHRITGDEAVDTLARVKAPLGRTTFEERVADFGALGLLEGTLADSSTRTAAWRAFAGDVQAGLPREEARARVARLAQALEAAGTTYSGYLAPVLAAYADHGAGQPDGADALGFLVDLATRKIHGEPAAAAMAAVALPAGRLTLAERVRTFHDLKLGDRESSVRLAMWAAVRAELDGGATPEAAAARLDRLSQACTAKELTYDGYVAPLFQAWADTLAGKPESDGAVDFLAGMVGRGIHGEDAAEALKEVAQPAGRLGFAQRVQEFAALKLWDGGRLGDSRTRLAVWSAFRRELDGGVAPADARARVERLAASFEGVSEYSGYTVPVFRAWQDGGAGTVDSEGALAFLTELVKRGIHGQDAAAAMAELVPPAGGLTLAERGRWFHDLGLSSVPALNQGPVRTAVWSTFRQDLATGGTPEAAKARIDRLAGAFAQQGTTWQGYVTPLFEAWRDHAPGSDEALQFLVDLVGKGVHGSDGAAALEMVARPAGPLTLAERIRAFQDLGLVSEGPLNVASVRAAVFEAFRAEVASGLDPAAAQARLGRLAQAFAQAEVTYEGYLQEGYAAYSQHFAGTPEAEAGLGLLTLLTSSGLRGSEVSTLAAELAQPAGPLTLPERVQAFQDLKLLGQERLSQPKLRTAVYSAFRADVAGGAAPAAARSRIERLSQALEGVTYDGYLAPPFQAWEANFAGTAQAEAGVAVLEELTKAGVQGDEVTALAAGLAPAFAGLSLPDRLGWLKRLALEGPPPLRERGVRGAVYEVFRKEASAGIPLADAEVRVRALTDALARAQVDYSSTLAGFLEAYSRTLAGDPHLGTRWPIRLLDKGVREGEIRESMELVKRDLLPLLERADTEIAAAVKTLLSRPPTMPWRDEIHNLKSTLEILLGAHGGEPAGTIGEDGGQVVIGDIRLPRN